MSSFICPYCSSMMVQHYDTYASYRANFFVSDDNRTPPHHHDTANIHFYKCPNCFEVSIFIMGETGYFEDKTIWIKPNSQAMQFPEYIPECIRADYEEACAIVDLSPKASATLSRRCLQGMIRDFWNIHKNTLFDEIEALEGQVPATQKQVIHSLRQIGNIGAHPEDDVSLIVDIIPEDAGKLIKIIELLMKQWYIERYETEKLIKDVNVLSFEMQEERKGE